MHWSLVYFCLLVTAVAAGTQYGSGEENYDKQQEEAIGDYYDPPAYIYEYSVDDRKNGVRQGHRQSRQGGSVSGEYSLLQADGSVRVVKYTADDVHGFRAVVTRHES